MEILVRSVGKYADITVKVNNTWVSLGIFDTKDALQLALSFEDGVQSILAHIREVGEHE